MTETTPTLKSDPQQETTSLMTLAQAGNGEAFCELCASHETRLLRQAMALCGDLRAAEELAQDTFVAAWKGLPRFHARCRFSTWLGSILIHLHKSRIRENQRTSRWLSSLGDEAGITAMQRLADNSDSPAEALAASEHAAFLRRCLEALPNKHRQVVFLRFYAQASLEDIAAALGCSIGTVKSRLFHALEKLRNMNRLSALANDRDPQP